MDKTTLKLENICLSFGGIQALLNVSMEAQQGEILGLIGPNGAGKTSLLNCISGFYRPQQGKILFNGQNITKLPPYKRAQIGIGRTFQQIELYSGATVLDNLLAGRHIFMKSGLLSSSIYLGWAEHEEIRHRYVVEEIIDFLEIAPIRKAMVGMLSYGQRKKVELGKALAMEPRLLLLDEPMAGMNSEEKEDMAKFILDIHEAKGYGFMKENTASILVEHDMGVVMDIVDRIVVLDWGQKIAEGPPEQIRLDQNVISVYLGEVA